ncbi:MAG TPA: sigma-54 dependent transcriptional regulator [Candidatus Acidoferrales bacterium]|nr:sigma-54 dependent transcriptional regulator [Candidatus Acidoferrales bacterium]
MEREPKEVVFGSQEMTVIMSQAERVARNEFSVLITGESGVGKEVVSRYIHQHSARAAEPFVAVNCGAIPETLFEAELFGFERGAFTNAFSPHRGYFEQANHGTILLDEISELPLTLQVKLLRVLEDKYIMRIGGEKEIQVDARVIAACNMNLQTLVRERKFRKDLYYRLAVSVIAIPPLRARKDDIETLAGSFLRKYSPARKILNREALMKLTHYEWPGNVRELEYCIIRSILNSDGKEVIRADDIQFLEDDIERSAAIERGAFEEALRKARGNVNSVSRLLGVHRNTVYNKIKRFNIDLLRYRNGHPVFQ